MQLVALLLNYSCYNITDSKLVDNCGFYFRFDCTRISVATCANDMLQHGAHSSAFTAQNYQHLKQTIKHAIIFHNQIDWVLSNENENEVEIEIEIESRIFWYFFSIIHGMLKNSTKCTRFYFRIIFGCLMNDWMCVASQLCLIAITFVFSNE